MGVKAETEEVLDTEQHEDTEQEDEETGQDGTEDESEGEESGEGGEGEDEEEVVVQIGSEEPPASEEAKAAPQWVKDLRAEQKRLKKENAELKARMSAAQPANTKPELPPKPKLAEFDYDEEAYDKARDEWDDKKRQADAWEADQEKQVKAAQEAQRVVHEGYAKSKQALGVKDYQDAEDEVVNVFSQVQQSIVIAGAANPAAMVYALGRTPKKLQELASIKDPVKFAVAIGKLETEVKVTKRTSTKPAPETTVKSNTSASTSSATLERLQAEADRTGDRTKVAAYLRQQRQAGK